MCLAVVKALLVWALLVSAVPAVKAGVALRAAGGRGAAVGGDDGGHAVGYVVDRAGEGGRGGGGVLPPELTTGVVWLTPLKDAHLTCRAVALPVAPL